MYSYNYNSVAIVGVGSVCVMGGINCRSRLGVDFISLRNNMNTVAVLASREHSIFTPVFTLAHQKGRLVSVRVTMVSCIELSLLYNSTIHSILLAFITAGL